MEVVRFGDGDVYVLSMEKEAFGFQRAKGRVLLPDKEDCRTRSRVLSSRKTVEEWVLVCVKVVRTWG